MSVAGDVGDAIVAAVQGLSLTKAAGGTLDSESVVRRKHPALPAGKNPPAVVVTIGEEGEVEYLTATEVLVSYPAALTIVTGSGTTTGDDETVRTWRQEIRRVLEAAATFSGVSGFNAVKQSGRIPFDAGALARDLNYSVILCVVEMIESRT